MEKGKKEKEERKALVYWALLGGELILDRCRSNLKENQDAVEITECDVLKLGETNIIRELYRGAYEIPENRSVPNWRMGETLKANWNIRTEVKKRIVLIKVADWAFCNLKCSRDIEIPLAKRAKRF